MPKWVRISPWLSLIMIKICYFVQWWPRWQPSRIYKHSVLAILNSHVAQMPPTMFLDNQQDVVTVRSSELLANLSLRTSISFWKREGLAGLGMWSVRVVQSEQHVIYRLMVGGGMEAQANMEETDGERLPWVEAHGSWPSRKEHLEIRCEICYACS